MAFEALGAAVDERYDARGIGFTVLVVFDHIMKGTIEPSSGFDVIETGDYHLELPVKSGIEVLNAPHMRRYSAARDPLCDELGGHLGLPSANVLETEQELPVCTYVRTYECMNVI